MQYTHQCNFTIGITTNKPHLFYTQLNSSMQNEFCCELSLVSFPLSPGGELVVILDVQIRVGRYKIISINYIYKKGNWNYILYL